MSRINDYLMKLEEEDKASDDPHRVLTKDSLMPTEEERNDYKDTFNPYDCLLGYFKCNTNAQLLPKI